MQLDQLLREGPVVTQVRVTPRPGFSYPSTRTVTMLERDYRELARRHVWLRRLRGNRLGIQPFPGNTLNGGNQGNTAVRHITYDDTSAAPHTLPKNAMHLVRVSPTGGTASGSLILGYAENRYAHFSTVIGQPLDYNVDWTVTGNQLASGFFTTDGTAPTDWGLTFAEKSWGGPPIADYLAVRVAVTAGGAVSTITNIAAVAFDAGESIPTWLQAYVATAAQPAVLYFPGEPGFQGGAKCTDTTKGTGGAPFTPAPRVSAANNVTMGYTCAAAGVVSGYVGYRPTSG